MKYLVAIILFLQIGCNPVKRLARQQKNYQTVVDEYNKNHPQRIDTATKFLPATDSSKFFKHIADSISKIKTTTQASIEIKYKDTCTSAPALYDQGFDFGYQIGYNSGKLVAPHDTSIQKFFPTSLIEDLQRQNRELLAGKNTADLTAIKNYSWKYKFWISTISGISLLLIVLLLKLIKK